MEKERQKAETLTIELGRLEAENIHLKGIVEEQEAFIADAERIADTQWDRASAAMDAQGAAEAKKKSADTEAAQIREKALRDAQKAADALLAAAQDQGVREALRVTEEVSKRLEAELLSEGQKALLNAERERDQWRTAFELLRDAVNPHSPSNSLILLS